MIRKPKGTDPVQDLLYILGLHFDNIFTPPPEPEIQIVEVSIPPGMYRKLLMLCHPDKHGGSALSEEVTRWLIAEREKTKSGGTENI